MRPFRPRPRKKGRQAGVFLLDVMLSVLIISMAAAAFFALFPTFKRSQKISEQDSKAMLMAQRMIEHLQLLKPADLNASTLGQLNLIDSGQSEAPFSFTHIPLDEGSNYSPNQVLKNANAQMEIDELSAASKRVKITITWTSPSGKTHTVTTGTILGGHR